MSRLSRVAVIATVLVATVLTAAPTGAATRIGRALGREDTTPPRLRFSYDGYQDFLHTHVVVVRVKSNEAAVLRPECTLLTREAAWGLEYVNRRLHPGAWIRFTCELRGGALRAAHTAQVRGGHPRVGIRLVAYDRAGNKASLPKLFIRP